LVPATAEEQAALAAIHKKRREEREAEYAATAVEYRQCKRLKWGSCRYLRLHATRASVHECASPIHPRRLSRRPK
jgi:hypothetical protein